MTKSGIKQLYIILALVFIASFVTYTLVPAASFLQEVTAIPLVGSLLVALFSIFKDILEGKRQQFLQSAQQGFDLGATSHMANVAFDKHASFSEEYMRETFSTLDTLFREGPTKQVMEHVAKFNLIRRTYAVWLTDELEGSLLKFESALSKIAANEMLLNYSKEAGNTEKTIKVMYSTFASVLGEDLIGSDNWEGIPLTKDVAIAKVTKGLRAILGTEELTKIRGSFIKKAIQEINNNDNQATEERPKLIIQSTKKV